MNAFNKTIKVNLNLISKCSLCQLNIIGLLKFVKHTCIIVYRLHACVHHKYVQSYTDNGCFQVRQY